MEDLKEYIVTAKDYECLECLYHDLETPGGSDTIPEREVHCCDRRPISRNTHYFLTDDEVKKLINDERVIFVESADFLRSMTPVTTFEQSSSFFNKGATENSNHTNWGLLRCERGQQIYAWGADGIPNQVGVITTTSTGKNVDVVILDTIIDGNDPEYAKNPDGTGGSRFVAYNWYQHNAALGLPASAPYQYVPVGQESHGQHVAGTVAGNTQGWARDANIYNITVFSYPGTNSQIQTSRVYDYIRMFHKTKPINPLTGHKNPTIVNNSWGIELTLHRDSNTGIGNSMYVLRRGTTYYGPFTDQQLESHGVMQYTSSGGSYGLGTITVSTNSGSINADIEDMINEGVITCGSSGNGRMKIDVLGGIDYNNRVAATYISSSVGTISAFGVFYHQGSSPGVGSSTICVGATNSAVVDAKRAFSDCGPRVNVFAPGTNIQSSHLTTGPVPDPRNATYTRGKLNGTSMSCPQVSGLLACLAEHYPRITQKMALEYIDKYWQKNALLNSGEDSYTDEVSLQGAANLYAIHVKDRKLVGITQPRTNHWERPARGNVWPRKSTVYGG